MASLRERVAAEFENIDLVTEQICAGQCLDNLSALEIAGVAALLHSFYNGIENILKQIAFSNGKEAVSGPFWHRDLLGTALSTGAISESTADRLKKYLAFRHFFTHGYSFDLDARRLLPLVEAVSETLAALKKDIKNYLDNR